MHRRIAFGSNKALGNADITLYRGSNGSMKAMKDNIEHKDLQVPTTCIPLLNTSKFSPVSSYCFRERSTLKRRYLEGGATLAGNVESLAFGISAAGAGDVSRAIRMTGAIRISAIDTSIMIIINAVFTKPGPEIIFLGRVLKATIKVIASVVGAAVTSQILTGAVLTACGRQVVIAAVDIVGRVGRFGSVRRPRGTARGVRTASSRATISGQTSSDTMRMA